MRAKLQNGLPFPTVSPRNVKLFTRMPEHGFAALSHAVLIPRGKSDGAGEGNRTLVCSLGSCRSAIELRPRNQCSTLVSENSQAPVRHRQMPTYQAGCQSG